jgi:hypothetical protein
VNEWRVRWKREGLAMNRKLFQTEKSARDLVALLEGHPTRGWAEDYDTGYNNSSDYWGAAAPKVVFISLESREVGKWEEKG